MANFTIGRNLFLSMTCFLSHAEEAGLVKRIVILFSLTGGRLVFSIRSPDKSKSGPRSTPFHELNLYYYYSKMLPENTYGNGMLATPLAWCRHWSLHVKIGSHCNAVMFLM